jgi:hypothetical protein
MPLLWLLLSIAAVIGPPLAEAAPASLVDLVAKADAIAVVAIVSADYSATAADGPMYAEAKVLKVVKGKLRAAQRIRFGASAWVGPNFQAGERRIVLLEAVPADHGYYRKARWASLEAGKIDLFIADKAMEKCSTEALLDFLKRQEGMPLPRKAEFQ